MSNFNIKGNQKDASTLLICAFRYALGRRTYIVDDVATIVKNNIDQLSIHDKELLVREINDAIHFKQAGDEMDVRCWDILKQTIISEIDKNE